MSGTVRGDLADDRTTDEGQVAEKVEDLVADELVAETEWTVDHALIVESDAVLDRAAPSQTGRAKLLDLAHEAEGPGWGDLPRKVVVIELELVGLATDRRVSEVDFVTEDQLSCRNHPDALVAFDDLDRFVDAQNGDLLIHLADAGGVDEVDERKGAAVDDGHFGTVDVDVDVRDAAGDNGREEVLDRSDRDVVATYSRGVFEGGGAGLQGRDAQVIEVGPNESDAASRVGRLQLQPGVDPGVKSDSRDSYRRFDCLPIYVHGSFKSSQITNHTGGEERRECHGWIL